MLYLLRCILFMHFEIMLASRDAYTVYTYGGVCIIYAYGVVNMVSLGYVSQYI